MGYSWTRQSLGNSRLLQQGLRRSQMDGKDPKITDRLGLLPSPYIAKATALLRQERQVD